METADTQYLFVKAGGEGFCNKGKKNGQGRVQQRRISSYEDERGD